MGKGDGDLVRPASDRRLHQFDQSKTAVGELVLAKLLQSLHRVDGESGGIEETSLTTLGFQKGFQKVFTHSESFL